MVKTWQYLPIATSSRIARNDETDLMSMMLVSGGGETKPAIRASTTRISQLWRLAGTRLPERVPEQVSVAYASNRQANRATLYRPLASPITHRDTSLAPACCAWWHGISDGRCAS